MAASSVGEVGRPKGDSAMLQPDLVTVLRGNTTNSNPLSHFELATTLGKDEFLREASVGNNLSPNFPSIILGDDS